jgi:drug/metabolite transporter (DMT)-like permease
MDGSVFLLVLVGAALHAGWNALVKHGTDRVIGMGHIALGAVPFAIPLVVIFGFPDPAAWPWLVGSTLLHAAYMFTLIAAYRVGDYTQVYPMARGSGPLIVALVGPLFVDEALTLIEEFGMAVMIAGLLLMALKGGRLATRPAGAAVGFALLTAVIIAGYTLTDGIGVRLSGTPIGYTAVVFLGDAIAMTIAIVYLRGPAGIARIARDWPKAMTGGGLSFGSYGIAIWAMSVAPIALVAALRETSIVFALLIGAVFLKEPLTRWRVAAVTGILAGVVLIRLGA